MLALLGKSIVGQIAGPLCAVLLTLLLMARCDNAVLKHDLKAEQVHSMQVQRNLDQCHDNGDELEKRLKIQNASIKALSDAWAQLAAQTAKELAEARKATEAAVRAGNRLLRPLTAPDQCSRVIEADRRVLDDLR